MNLRLRALWKKSQASLFWSIITLGVLFGAMSAGFFMDKFGRKRGLLATVVMFMIGLVPIVPARGIEEILISSMVTGFAGCMSTVVTLSSSSYRASGDFGYICVHIGGLNSVQFRPGDVVMLVGFRLSDTNDGACSQRSVATGSMFSYGWESTCKLWGRRLLK